MTWRVCGTYSGFPPRMWLVHSAECERAAKQGKVPAWTAEDEANLARRVRRIGAKADR
jgi:hypothetical protein